MTQLSLRLPTLSGAAIARRLPGFVELLALAGVVALLLPLFARLAELGTGRDQRFDAVGFVVRGLPAPVLPALCRSHGSLAEPAVHDRLCGRASSTRGSAAVDELPALLKNTLVAADHAFVEPVLEAEARLAPLKLQQREGIGDLRALSDQIAGLEADTQPFAEHFELIQTEDSRGPAPLICASRAVEAALQQPDRAASSDGAATMARANLILLLAAAFDGHAATEGLANQALLPPASARGPPVCGTTHDLGAALSAASSLMADARLSTLNLRKNDAVQSLLRTAGWQWAGAMLLGLLFVKASRWGLRPALGIGLALLLWAGAAWYARVPWPLAGSHGFEPGRADALLWSPPSTPLLALAIGGALMLLVALLRRPRTGRWPQTISTRVGYPGLALATGLGWLLLLDLSAHGHFGNRYLALYHQGHLWLGMLCFSVLLFLRQPLARGLAWTLSIAGELAGGVQHRLGSFSALLLLSLLGALAIAAVGLVLTNMRQLTSELGRVWLIVGAAWFFFLRAAPLAERLARSGASVSSVLRYVWPMLFVIAGLLELMLVTHDMGPLLIAGYASGAFLASSLALWWYQRSGRRASAFVLAVLLFVAWTAVITTALFKLGSVDSTTASRLESLNAPLASTNDQLALVTWFQHAAPANGFGIGAVPWCGYTASGSCSGVPAQIHSDYTFTAIVGAFGSTSGWLAAIGCALWLHRLVRHHGRVTRGEPRLVAASGRIANDGQAFLSWIAVAWVVLTLCQLAVTVAGNLAVLPLTGVTFPFVSFGMTSLLVNLAFLALCINVNLPQRERHV